MTFPFPKAALAMCALALSSLASAATPHSEFPLSPGFTSEFHDVDGVRLHTVSGGRGPLVLLVHGVGQTWYEWHSLLPELARTHRVVAVDPPGLGESAPPRSACSGEDVSDHRHRLARRIGPNAPFDLVAHDIGIWNTYPMAARHPEGIAHNRVLSAQKLPMPTLAIGGGHGGMGQFQVDQMRRHATQVEGHVLPGCGHWLPEECADVLNPLVVGFLTRDGGAR